MKHILFIIAILFSASSFAQHTYPGVPLYGTTAGQDRTYRSLQLGQTVITNTVTATVGSFDTITLIPGFVSGGGAVFHKNYFISAVDTVVLAIKDASSSYTGSTMTFILTASATTAFYFLGYSGWSTSQWALASAATKYAVTTNRFFTISFICTGTAWVELYHSQD